MPLWGTIRNLPREKSVKLVGKSAENGISYSSKHSQTRLRSVVSAMRCCRTRRPMYGYVLLTLRIRDLLRKHTIVRRSRNTQPFSKTESSILGSKEGQLIGPHT
jgi:hypothetical protein